MKKLKTNVLPLILVFCLILMQPSAAADEANRSIARCFGSGLLLVDVGASIAEGIALVAGVPNRLNCCFGAAAGPVSFGIVVLGDAVIDDEDLRNDFALVYGKAGSTSFIIGAVTVRLSPPFGMRASRISGVRFFPYITIQRCRRQG